MTVRTAVLSLTIAIMACQSTYAQPLMRLGVGASYEEDFELGYAVMAGVEAPMTPLVSILIEGGYRKNPDSADHLVTESFSLFQADIGIKLNADPIYVFGLIGYSKPTAEMYFSGNNYKRRDGGYGIGGGGGVFLWGPVFSEVQLYKSGGWRTDLLFRATVGIRRPFKQESQ